MYDASQVGTRLNANQKEIGTKKKVRYCVIHAVFPVTIRLTEVLGEGRRQRAPAKEGRVREGKKVSRRSRFRKESYPSKSNQDGWQLRP